ncbi:interferon regulatory factor 1-like isoform X2 [Ostrea edulis]|uniref:interferon regulatory factor 1-like isoform X2 n=2 Tax=Ostrea edulis TaxID=37623 RepID=UPI0024AFEBE9|nr:interferon regulatory factor 1-like isoform X2 [Ostrea edulis]
MSQWCISGCLKHRRMVQKKHSQPVITQRKPIRPIERQKMRPWLVNLLNNENVAGFSWESRHYETFRISWRHAARQGWDPEVDASLFERWAKHTGKFVDGDEPDPKRWKANFRCALNSLPDVRQLKDQGQRKGKDAYKVYQFLNEKKTVHKHKVTERTSVPKITHTKTKRTLRARNAKRISYAKMIEMDSEGEEDDSSSDFIMSESDYSTSLGDQTPERMDDMTSDIEPMHEDGLETRLPDFNKICKSTDLTSLQKYLPSEKDLRIHVSCSSPSTNSLFNALTQVSPSAAGTRDDESASTTSSTITDEELVQMVLESEVQTPENDFPDLWGSGFPVPQEVAYVDAIIEEGDTTYFILDNVENEVVITDTPAVRCEQITNGELMQYTGLSDLAQL